MNILKDQLLAFVMTLADIRPRDHVTAALRSVIYLVMYFVVIYASDALLAEFTEYSIPSSLTLGGALGVIITALYQTYYPMLYHEFKEDL